MRLAIIPAWLPDPRNNPASGVFFLERASIMHRFSGCQTGVLAPRIYRASQAKKLSLSRRPEIRKESRDGMAVWRVNWPRILRNRSAPNAAMDWAWKDWVAENGRPDMVMVLSVLSAAGTAAMHLKHTHGIPYFVVENSGEVLTNRPTKPKIQRARISAWREAEFVAVVGEELRGVLLSAAGIKAHLLHNPLPIGFPPEDQVRPPEARPFRIHCTGRLHPDKGQDLIIKAFAEFVAGGVDAELTVAGAGECEAALRALVDQLGLKDRVELCGHISRDELVAKLTAADLYVSASTHETFNNGIAEALACGVPCISSPTGVALSVLCGDNGLLLNGRQPEAILAGMRHVHERAEQYDREAISTEAKRMFSARAWAETLMTMAQKKA